MHLCPFSSRLLSKAEVLTYRAAALRSGYFRLCVRLDFLPFPSIVSLSGSDKSRRLPVPFTAWFQCSVHHICHLPHRLCFARKSAIYCPEINKQPVCLLPFVSVKQNHSVVNTCSFPGRRGEMPFSVQC